MNRLIMIYGCVLLSSSAIAVEQQHIGEVPYITEAIQAQDRFENLITAVDHKAMPSTLVSNPAHKKDKEAYDMDLSKIEYIEDETIELGFDPYDYLPEHFDPHSFFLDLNTLEFMEEEEGFCLDFDTAKYLPEDFNAFAGPNGMASINYIEGEDVDLGFETEDYLPEGFSPFEPYFDLNAIEYIEMDDSVFDFLAFPENGNYSDFHNRSK